MGGKRTEAALVVCTLSALLAQSQVFGEVSLFGPTLCNQAEIVSLQVFITAFFVFAVLCLLIFWCRCIVLVRDIRYKKYAWMHTEHMKNKVYERRGNELLCWFALIPSFLAAFFIMVALLVNCSNRTPAPVVPSFAPTLSPMVPTSTPTASPSAPTNSPAVSAVVPTTIPTNITVDGNTTLSNSTNSTNSSLLGNSTNSTNSSLPENTTIIEVNVTTGLNETVPSSNTTVVLNETSGSTNLTAANTSETVLNTTEVGTNASEVGR